MSNYNIGSNLTLSGEIVRFNDYTVTSSDPTDVFKFTALEFGGYVQAFLRNLSGDADLSIYLDSNKNGYYDSTDSLLSSSSYSGTSDDSVVFQTSYGRNSGVSTMFAVVNRYVSASSIQYDLELVMRGDPRITSLAPNTTKSLTGVASIAWLDRFSNSVGTINEIADTYAVNVQAGSITTVLEKANSSYSNSISNLRFKVYEDTNQNNLFDTSDSLIQTSSFTSAAYGSKTSLTFDASPGLKFIQVTDNGSTNIAYSLNISHAFKSGNDLNNDSFSDIVWRNQQSGDNILWLMNGTGVSQGLNLGNVDPSWTLTSLGDFDGNGSPDLLWRNQTSGSNILWKMSGTAVQSGINFGSVAADWKVAATADFDSDGDEDIVWRNSNSGDNIIWTMNREAVVSGRTFSSVPLGWEIGAAADLDKNGSTDLVWRNSQSGQNIVWLGGVNNPTTIELGVVPGEWKLSGAADFDKNGSADLMWRHQSSGDNLVWLMNGTSVQQAISLGNVPAGWNPVV